ncbi:MAG: glycosyltransferase family 4 protein [Vicinamibacterales bacterium]|jgi:glycosyltransferase involved in cell wall biosynthesis|nr:glycosyltransferase family 4 protein [Vicinamibacterales bacterium]MDP7473220.1 glycosyltransferase family 4 protein [Vicinamibacterales bacterium]MDP7671575.1 glycosyltransferase family 4 protein [Vicinamibacterales bacterium]HJO38376.1 glycosyltransferase family 4 protein [Vicinamibacterales bacterium]|tara:strand:+ start:2707 stop:3903 length:1197 start_codon:yes stop_codon:yes gene_type:complete
MTLDGSGPLRVLVVAPTPFFGDRGCHIRIYEEVRGLAALGVESSVVTYPSGRDLPDVEIHRATSIPGIRARELGPSWTRPVIDLSLWRAARRVARWFRPHLIHAHLHEGIAIGTRLRASLSVPLVADLQGSLAAELVDHGFLPAHGLRRRLVQRIETWLSQQPDLVLTSSSHGVTWLAEHGVPTARIEALPDGVDLERFRPLPLDDALRAQLGLVGKRVVVFLGVLTPYQGVDLLLDAAVRVVADVPDAHFLVMGYPNEDHYRDEIRSRGLQAAVTLPGRIPYDEAPRWLGLGHVAVSPKQSLTEANGKLLNYMACGLPVVASETPVNRELLGDEGIYAAVGDADALAQRLVDALKDAEGGRRRGDALRRRAEERFAWPVLAARLANLYRGLSATPPP